MRMQEVDSLRGPLILNSKDRTLDLGNWYVKRNHENCKDRTLDLRGPLILKYIIHSAMIVWLNSLTFPNGVAICCNLPFGERARRKVKGASTKKENVWESPPTFI